LYKRCPACKGTKIIHQTAAQQDPEGPLEWVEEPCILCDVNGMIVFGELDDDLIDFLGAIKNKVDDIKEKVDEIKEVVDAL